MKHRFLVSIMSMLLLGGINIGYADVDPSSNLSNSSGVNHSKGHNGLVTQFTDILTPEQLADVRQYEVQQRVTLKNLALKSRKDKQNLYNLLVSSTASPSAVDQALAVVNDDRAQLASIKLNLMRYAYSLANDDQKLLINKIFAEQLTSTKGCALAREKS